MSGINGIVSYSFVAMTLSHFSETSDFVRNGFPMGSESLYSRTVVVADQIPIHPDCYSVGSRFDPLNNLLSSCLRRFLRHGFLFRL